MDAAKVVSANESAQEKASFAFMQGKERQKDPALQQQKNDVPVTQARSSNTSSLLIAASPPADRASAGDGYGVTRSVNATIPVTTTTTSSTVHPTTTTTTGATTTTTSTITSAVNTSKAAAPQARVVFLHIGDGGPSPVWDHYCECAMLLHGISYPDTWGSELVRQVVRIPSTTDSYVPDDDFADSFIALVEAKFATQEGMQALNQEMNSRWDYQKRTTSAEGEKLAVWISLFNCALRVAKALPNEGGSAGAQVSTAQLDKLRRVIDNRRKELVRIHLGGQHQNVASPVIKPDNASTQENAQATPHKRRRAGSMTALFPVASPEGGKKALPELPKEQLAGFESKAKALLGWKKKADKKFEKHHVDQSVLRLFEQCFGDLAQGWTDIYCIAYKFVALVRFAEVARGSVIRDVLIEEIDNELGYVNEILLFREKLKGMVRLGPGGLPEEIAYYSIWLDFFQQVGTLMDFRRSNRETAVSESPEMAEILVKCEVAYGNVVKKTRQATDLRQKQDEDAQARRKADRIKERRLKGRSMDFLMPGKEKRAADPSATRDTDAIGLSPRKKIDKQGKQRDDIPVGSVPSGTKAGLDGPIPQDRKGIRKHSPAAESLPDSAFSASGQPTSPTSVSRQKKKLATFEVNQQEAGPARVGEKKKTKAKAIRQEQQTSDVREAGQGDKSRKAGKEKKAVKEEKVEKMPGKTTRGTKDD